MVPQMLQTELDAASQQLEAQTAEYDEVQHYALMLQTRADKYGGA